MKVVISIYKTNFDMSHSFCMVSQAGDYAPKIEYYGWKHEFPEEEKLKEALNLIWEAVKNG